MPKKEYKLTSKPPVEEEVVVFYKQFYGKYLECKRKYKAVCSDASQRFIYEVRGGEFREHSSFTLCCSIQYYTVTPEHTLCRCEQLTKPEK